MKIISKHEHESNPEIQQDKLIMNFNHKARKKNAQQDNISNSNIKMLDEVMS